MTINKAKSSNYDSVTPKHIAIYIQQYADWINQTVNPNDKNKINTQLKNANKTQLKLIAAELETVQKRLNYILEGIY